MDIRVSILSDNVASAPAFMGEHGLSIMIETPNGSVLFDCGQSDVAVRNARILGIDLQKVECIALSHGHYDHTAGLLHVLLETGRKKVFAHPDAFLPRFFQAGPIKRYIGIPFNDAAVRSSCEELMLSKEQVELISGVYLTGEIERIPEYTYVEPNLYVERDGELTLDDFRDDQALVVETEDGMILITGCAHAGIANTVKYVGARFGKIRAIIGGTHLGLTDPKQLEPSIKVLKDIDCEKLIFTHCTGIRLIGAFMSEFGERYAPGQSGMVLNF